MTDTVSRRYSLLVVDDNEMNRDLLTRRLEQLGYLVATVNGGREALQRLEVESYDLVLLDIMMPEVDGFQVLEQLRQKGISKRVPIMMVTAVNDMENVMRCVNLGARDYIAKPFDPTLLKTRVAKVIEKYAGKTAGERGALAGAEDVEGHILVVDDNEMNRCVVQEQLGRLGYKVSVAANGREGLARIQAGGIDMVLLDLMMPEMDGHAVLEAIKRDEKTRALPVIMLSASDDPQIIARCTKAGAADYLVKPFNSVLLKLRINNALAPAAAASSAAAVHANLKQRIAVEVRKKMLSNTLELPVVSDVATTITQLSRADMPISEVTKVITLDAALTAKLISIANSNFYRGLSKVEKVDDAITRLGLNETKRYVMTMINKQAYRGGRSLTARYAEETWQHALSVAQAARAIAEQCKLGDPGRFYTLGLVHDIGVAVILKSIDDVPAAADAGSRELVQDLVDELHHEVGAYLARRWMFPEAFESAVAEHHSAERSLATREAQVLVVAEAIAAKLGVVTGEPGVADLRVTRARELLGVDDARFADIATATEAQLKEIKTVM